MKTFEIDNDLFNDLLSCKDKLKIRKDAKEAEFFKAAMTQRVELKEGESSIFLRTKGISFDGDYLVFRVETGAIFL